LKGVLFRLNFLKKGDFKFIVLAADIGALLPINYINIMIITQGGITLIENNLFIITIEVVGTAALTALNVAWLLRKFRVLKMKSQLETWYKNAIIKSCE
jgi:hypothetical protein